MYGTLLGVHTQEKKKKKSTYAKHSYPINFPKNGVIIPAHICTWVLEVLRGKRTATTNDVFLTTPMEGSCRIEH